MIFQVINIIRKKCFFDSEFNLIFEIETIYFFCCFIGFEITLNPCLLIVCLCASSLSFILAKIIIEFCRIQLKKTKIQNNKNQTSCIFFSLFRLLSKTKKKFWFLFHVTYLSAMVTNVVVDDDHFDGSK